MSRSFNTIKLRLILTISICILAIVFIVELGLGAEPCILCKYQRIPYFSVIFFSGLALHIKTVDRLGVVRLIGITFFISGILALYHHGIEQHWWNTTIGCGASDTLPKSFENFQSQLMVKLPKRCDEVDWTFFGLSMTVYNMIASFILAVLSFSTINLRMKYKK